MLGYSVCRPVGEGYEMPGVFREGGATPLLGLLQ